MNYLKSTLKKYSCIHFHSLTAAKKYKLLVVVENVIECAPLHVHVLYDKVTLCESNLLIPNGIPF